MTVEHEDTLRREYEELGLTSEAIDRYIRESKEREVIADYEW